MLINVKPVSDLRSLARVRSRSFDTKSVHTKLIEEETANGWTVLREGKVSVRLSRPKSHGVLLEDRVWSLLYRMQFDYLSDKGGAKLPIDLRASTGPTTQIDVVGLEADIALAVECKSQ